MRLIGSTGVIGALLPHHSPCGTGPGADILLPDGDLTLARQFTAGLSAHAFKFRRNG